MNFWASKLFLDQLLAFACCLWLLQISPKTSRAKMAEWGRHPLKPLKFPFKQLENHLELIEEQWSSLLAHQESSVSLGWEEGGVREQQLQPVSQQEDDSECPSLFNFKYALGHRPQPSDARRQAKTSWWRGTMHCEIPFYIYLIV